MKFLFFACLFCFSMTAFAQSNYLTEQSASKGILKSYEKANAYARAGEFEKAKNEVSKILDKEPTFLNARLLLGNILYEQKAFIDSEKEFLYILDKDATFENGRTYYNLALVEKKLRKFKEAQTYLQAFIETNPKQRMLDKANKHLENAKFLEEIYANPVPFEPKNLNAPINTEAREYLPSFTADGQSLIFTRAAYDEKRGSYFEDFYSTKKNETGEWETPQPLSTINTPENEGAQTVTADGKMIVFTGCNRPKNIGGCDLYFSILTDGEYSTPQLLPEPINTRYWESQASLTPNGDGLYFASTRPGGMGKSDIYTTYLVNGKWTNPMNIGKAINTPEDDVTPFIHADGQTLYFSSEGHPTVGGRDLYYARWNAEKKAWDTPKNMGVPINTEREDSALTISLDGKKAYFSSNRSDLTNAQGTMDLYSFDLYEAAQPQKVTYVKANVTDAITGLPLDVQVEINDVEKSTLYTSVQTGTNGTFLIVMGVGKSYALTVDKKGYLFYSDNFALEQEREAVKPFLLDIKLNPIPITKVENNATATSPPMPVVLKNIFFETGSSDLLPTSFAELERLKQLLTENADLKVQINGHTDDIGSEADNLILSTARAYAVYEWLMQHGIDEKRLKYKGYGETQPIADNTTNQGRRTNRRTEFVIW